MTQYPTDYCQRLMALMRSNETFLFDDLAEELFQWHTRFNPVYRRFCERRGGAQFNGWQDIPALPTAAFKELDVTWLPAEEWSTVFHSSGTTQSKPSRHFHNPTTLAVYEASLVPWFTSHVIYEQQRPFLFVALTPPIESAPHSSLVHMFNTLERRSDHAGFYYGAESDEHGAWHLKHAFVRGTLEKACAQDLPVVLLGPAFAYVELLDSLPDLALPPGSRAMETGGYKGRTRALHKTELRAALSARFGLPSSFVLGEYGMSELSSQAYDGRTGEVGGVFQFPPWARARIVSPEDGRAVAEGELGLIRIVDLANVSSAPAVQTEDLGRRRGGGFEWVGRAGHAASRGCSLMIAGPAAGG